MRKRLDEAFEAVPRAWFLPPAVRDEAGHDVPLSIGHGQTNSQPTTVRFMLRLLDVQPGMHVLDVGCGTGWTTGLLAWLVGSGGHVVATERIAALATAARDNLAEHELPGRVEVRHTPDVLGHPDEAPYDRILVSAAGPTIPPDLLAQLAAPGRMVVPVQHSIIRIDRLDDGRTEAEEHRGFRFVPLIT